MVVHTLEEDCRRHNIGINVVVTRLKVDKTTREETDESISYLAWESVSRVIKRKREWMGKEGNHIRLDFKVEITHWFNYWIPEDRCGDLTRDNRNRLTFHANKPIR